MSGIADDDLLDDERQLAETGSLAGEEGSPTETEPKAEVAAEQDGAPAAEAGAPAEQPAEAPAAAPAAAPAEAIKAPLVDDVGAPILVPVEPKDFKAEFAALDAKLEEIESRWAKGEIDDAERAKEALEVRQQERDLIRAETLQESAIETNRNAVAAAQQQFLGNLMATSKAAGQINYDSPAAQAAFNATLQQLQGSDEFKTISSFDDVKALYRKTHETVMAAFGVAKPTAAAPAAAPAVQAMQAGAKPQIPPTLSGIPAAAQAPVGNERLAALTNTDDPDEAERALNAMPAAEREAMFRSAMNPSTRRR